MGPSTVGLGEHINLSLTIENAQPDPQYGPYDYLYIGYEIKKTNDANFNQFVNTFGNKIDCFFNAAQPGEWDVRAYIQYPDGEEVYSDIETITILNPEVNLIKSQMETQMATTWQDTKNAASPSGRHEIGYYIYANTTSGSLVFEAGTTNIGPTWVCGQVTAWSITDYEGTFNPNFENGGRFLVGLFHTHTPVAFCNCYVSCRSVGPSPSPGDLSLTDLPGLVYDYIGPIYSFFPLDSDAKIYEYGSTRRTRIYPNQ